MIYFYWLNKLFQIFKKCIVDIQFKRGGIQRQENFVKFLLKFDILTPPQPFLIKLIEWDLTKEKWEKGPFFVRFPKGSEEKKEHEALVILALINKLLDPQEIKIDPFHFIFKEIPRKPLWCVEIGEKNSVSVKLDEVGDIGIVYITCDGGQLKKLANDCIEEKKHSILENSEIKKVLERVKRDEQMGKIYLDNSHEEYTRFDFELIDEIAKNISGDKLESVRKTVAEHRAIEELSKMLECEIFHSANLNDWAEVFEPIMQKTKSLKGFLHSLLLPLIAYLSLNEEIKLLRYFVPGTWWNQDGEEQEIRVHTASCGLLTVFDEKSFRFLEDNCFKTQSYSLDEIQYLYKNKNHSGKFFPDGALSDIFTHIYSQNFTIEQWIGKTKAEFIKASVGSAIAAIMARNMSHNIGSHALWHLAHESLGSNFTVNTNQLKSFFNYIRERMGFLGLISTVKPTWGIEMGLKKLIEEFKKEEILLRNIVKSETKRAVEIEYLGSGKAEAQIPHGILGAQALYVIIENVIRNSIKHNPDRINVLRNEALTFTVQLADEDNWEEDEKKWKYDYHKVLVYDEFQSATEELVADLNGMIDDEIVDGKSGKLNNRYLGLKEMKISAGFLQMLPPGNYNQNVGLPVLRVNSVSGNLAHIFYIKKPKEVLIISKKTQKDKKKFIDKGIYFYDETQIEQNRERILDFQMVLIDSPSLQDATSFFEKYERNRWYFPFRGLAVEGLHEIPEGLAPFPNSILSSFLEDPTEEKKASLWKIWIDFFFEDRAKKEVIILSGKADEQKNNSLLKLENLTKKDDYDPRKNIVITHDVKISNEKRIFANSYFLSGFRGEAFIEDMAMKGNLKLFYRFYESCLLKIAVVDERIWSRRDDMCIPEKYEYEHKLREIWEKRQVVFFDHAEFIYHFEDKFVDEISSYQPDVLIIHQGVIDKFVGVMRERRKDRKQGKKEAMRLFKEKIVDQIKRVVIDSDRGKPEEVRNEGGVWLDFADLSRVLIQDAEGKEGVFPKYVLVNLVTSLREEFYD